MRLIKTGKFNVDVDSPKHEAYLLQRVPRRFQVGICASILRMWKELGRLCQRSRRRVLGTSRTYRVQQQHARHGGPQPARTRSRFCFRGIRDSQRVPEYDKEEVEQNISHATDGISQSQERSCSLLTIRSVELQDPNCLRYVSDATEWPSSGGRQPRSYIWVCLPSRTCQRTDIPALKFRILSSDKKWTLGGKCGKNT